MDSELIEQQLPERVVLVVADPLRQCHRDARVVERQPSRMVRELPGDVAPFFCRNSRASRFERGCMAALHVELPVAELGDVQVRRVVRGERAAAQEGLDKIRGRRVVLVPRDPADLRLRTGIAEFALERRRLQDTERGAEAETPESRHYVPAYLRR